VPKVPVDVKMIAYEPHSIETNEPGFDNAFMQKEKNKIEQQGTLIVHSITFYLDQVFRHIVTIYFSSIYYRLIDTTYRHFGNIYYVYVYLCLYDRTLYEYTLKSVYLCMLFFKG
jgi:hypothetical protein